MATREEEIAAEGRRASDEAAERFRAKFDADMARFKREQEIHCPHCDALYDDSDEHHHVSYWGEDSQTEVECENEDCGKSFWLEEHVSRTYTTAMSQEGLNE